MRDGVAVPSAENLDPAGPSAASDVIKCVVMFYERGTSGNNFIRKEKFRAVLNRNTNYKTSGRLFTVPYFSLSFFSPPQTFLSHGRQPEVYVLALSTFSCPTTELQSFHFRIYNLIFSTKRDSYASKRNFDFRLTLGSISSRYGSLVICPPPN